MSTPLPRPTIAFLGATGGCTIVCLKACLLASPPYPCVALARTPSKLPLALIAAGVPQSTIDAHLTIVPGNATSVEDVKKFLTAPASASAASPPPLPHTIISGLGGKPYMAFQWRHPARIFDLDQPSICGDGAAALCTALAQLYAAHPPLAAHKPLLTCISTTGLTARGTPVDVPFALRWIYHHVLAIPHNDKREMERVFFAASPHTASSASSSSSSSVAEPVFAAAIALRPTLLTDGEARGVERVRAGPEARPALGYQITRADVGRWMFREIVERAGEGWKGEKVSLAY